MRRLILGLLAFVILGPIALLAAADIALNTGAGRAFAEHEINQLASPQLHITGLAGHFPADLKLRHAGISDSKGIYLTADNLELRWRPLELFSRTLHVTSLTASSLTLLRQPIQAASSQNAGSSSPPNAHLVIDHLAIGALTLPAALAGRPTTLAVTGAAQFPNDSQGQLTLAATAAANRGAYHVTARFNPNNIDAEINIAEPPDGLIGHFAGPQIHAPLNLSLTLHGPRENAVLAFTASLGGAALNGAGIIGLNPSGPKADIILTVPHLAPFAAFAGQTIEGSTTLHLIASRSGATTTVALDGDVGVTSAPGPAAKLIGPNGHLAFQLTLANNQAALKTLAITGAGFNATASGTLARNAIALTTRIALNDAASLSPAISGPVAETGEITGAVNDFSIHAIITGDISEPKIQSGPFSITIDARHLPRSPAGTVTGAGALENAPLILAAQVSSAAGGATQILVDQAHWRSLSAHATLSLAPDAALPTGTADFAIGNLADLSNFTTIKLAGGIDGSFSHQGGQNVSLTLNAHHVIAVPSVGAIDAALTAAGPLNALPVKLSAQISKILNAPAQLALTFVLDLNRRAAAISAVSASWRTASVKLLGPASVETEPGLAVRHLALALNGGRVDLDGTLTPRLNATLSAQNIPASLAALAVPSLAATGTLGLSGALGGTMQAPTGNIAFTAAAVRIRQGIAASLPPASLNATLALLPGRIANLNASLALARGVQLAAAGQVPLTASGPISLRLTGTADLRLADPIIAAQGTTIRGVLTPDLTITGTPTSPRADGTVALTGGALQNVGSGLNLTNISAHLAASGRLLTLQSFQAGAGAGQITGHGTFDLGQPAIPIDLVLNASNATPIASDLATESFNAALTIKGAALGPLSLDGVVDLLSANINIPKSLPPAVADLPIVNLGQPRLPPPPAPPPIALNLTVRADNRIFIRGDGLFAELGGTVHLTGTAADPQPQGGFTLIRGNFALAGKSLQFTQGTINFTGDGFTPTLDLEATAAASNNATASLIVGGTPDKPTITLTASPPLPSDEVLSELLFGQATATLSPFQAASLAAALASLSGIGGSAIADPLGGVRNALGLDELSLGGSGAGAPTVNAGRYVAPGIYVGAQQSTSGQGTQATVQINLYKGLQLKTSTGTAAAGTGGGVSSSVGLSYQFNY